MPVSTYCFEIVPAGFTLDTPLSELRFEPMLVDVPTAADDADFAARRAYWTAFHMLGARGVDVDEFEVYEYSESRGRGRRVTMGGFVVEVPA